MCFVSVTAVTLIRSGSNLSSTPSVLHNPYLLNKSRDSSDSDGEAKGKSGEALPEIRKINFQASRSGQTNRYAFHFYQESEKQLKAMKLDGRRAVEPLPQTALEIGDRYFVGYDFPRRPTWTYAMSREQLDHSENRSFRDFMQALEKRHCEDNQQLSYCELNLETWRQLWRVLELSEVLLFVVDVRTPTLMFPPALYDYVRGCGKWLVLVLNKIDLVPSAVTVAWRSHFAQHYPGIHVVTFTSFPGRASPTHKSLQRRRRFGRLRMAIQGALQVQETCARIVGDRVDLSSWRHKIQSELERCQNEEEEGAVEVEQEAAQQEERPFDFRPVEQFKDGVLTVGCLGFPNAGKSSLMNALMGRKVVSVSRTPGHTKHFQTIFLTQTVRLCDCPGLVFPSCVPRALQVLMGSYPIAQLREPYAPLRYLAERVSLVDVLNLRDADVDSFDGWSPIALCDAWATQRGFLTARSARPDTFRAANHILRMALDGKIVLSLRPEGFFARAEYWQGHTDNAEILQILNRQNNETDAIEEEGEEEESSDEAGDEGAAGGPSRVVTKNPFELLADDC